jgi:chromate transporter
VLPTTILMLVMVIYFFGIKDSPTVKSMLTAVRPVVVGLLVWTAYDMAKTVFSTKTLGWGQALAQGWDKALIAAAAFGLLTFTNINPVFIIIGAAILGLIIYR